MTIKHFLTLILLLNTALVFSQLRIKETSILEEFRVDNLTTQNFRSEKPTTAVAIKSDTAGEFRLITLDSSLIIPRDPDTENHTYFISLSETLFTFSISSDIKSYDVFLIHSGEGKITDASSRLSFSDDCQDPLPTISQEEWRAGLPEPDYTRSFHEVNHNIVHHSAGSNSSTNFVQVVRDIYIYHTEVNGWSDIGYNYLIAQDGTIFNGRDPGTGSQDAVIGAHFCGRNSGTLGICLLGNYETTNPTSSAITSLETILTYQLFNQENNPFERFNHTLGNLGTIAGHRDGCSTLCPGENVYAILGMIRESVSLRIADCVPPIPLSIEVDSTLVKVGESVSFQARGSYESFIWHLDGAFPSTSSESIVTVSYGVPGIYDVRLVGINADNSDTLELPDFIKVSFLENRPILFPNPVLSNRFTIDFNEEIKTVAIYSVTGEMIMQASTSQMNLESLRSGTYLVRIIARTKTYVERLVIL